MSRALGAIPLRANHLLPRGYWQYTPKEWHPVSHPRGASSTLWSTHTCLLYLHHRKEPHTKLSSVVLQCQQGWEYWLNWPSQLNGHRIWLGFALPGNGAGGQNFNTERVSPKDLQKREHGSLLKKLSIMPPFIWGVGDTDTSSFTLVTALSSPSLLCSLFLHQFPSYSSNPSSY